MKRENEIDSLQNDLDEFVEHLTNVFNIEFDYQTEQALPSMYQQIFFLVTYDMDGVQYHSSGILYDGGNIMDECFRKIQNDIYLHLIELSENKFYKKKLNSDSEFALAKINIDERAYYLIDSPSDQMKRLHQMRYKI